ncbi:MAG: type VII toxin-antitoxin system HepT family RNase toxin [Thermoproteota archaeon]
MKEEIYSKLEDLKRYVQFLRGYQSHTKQELREDHTLRGAVERYFQLALECTLNIGEMIISEEGFRKPESYRQVIEILGEERVLPREFTERFAPSMGFRNILVHRYAEVDVDQMYHRLQDNLQDFNTFAQNIAQYIQDKD